MLQCAWEERVDGFGDELRHRRQGSGRDDHGDGLCPHIVFFEIHQSAPDGVFARVLADEVFAAFLVVGDTYHRHAVVVGGLLVVESTLSALLRHGGMVAGEVRHPLLLVIASLGKVNRLNTKRQTMEFILEPEIYSDE